MSKKKEEEKKFQEKDQHLEEVNEGLSTVGLWIEKH